MDYGWSFFLTSLEVSARMEHERIKELATAVRAGSTANKQQWERFLRGNA
jgi:hypothetical protein